MQSFAQPFSQPTYADARMPQFIDSGNSKVYTDDSFTFTGAWTQTRLAGIVRQLVFLSSDVATGLGGTLIIEWSEDQVNPTVARSFSINSFSTIREFNFVNLGGFYRIKFTPDRVVTSSEAINITSVLETQYTGPLVGVGSSSSQSIDVTPFDFDQEVALGNVAGYSNVGKFGRVRLVDAADTPCDIWAFADDDITPSGLQKVFPSVAATLYLCSSSASDTSVDVYVEYIDENGDHAVISSVTLNGQTPVSLGVTGLDINRMAIISPTSPVGKVYGSITNDFSASGEPNDTNDIIAFIPIGYNQTEQTHYTVPNNKTLIMKSLSLPMSRASGSPGSVDIALEVTPFGQAPLIKRQFPGTDSISASDSSIKNLVVSGRSSIRWIVQNISDVDTNISCIWGAHLVDA